jgi:SAM-dependent methyltransferase
MTALAERETDLPASPFDTLAADYDDSFTSTWTGRAMRQAVWRRIDDRFRAGDTVLDVGCGTGEDAVHLATRGISVVAIDSSDEMVRAARSKTGRCGIAPLVTCERLDICNRAAINAMGAPFDGLLSNFGALNCVPDLDATAADLAALVRPGATLMVCVMGPFVPWEWGWFLAHGDARKAIRRLRPGGANWRGARIRYPSVRTVRAAFSPHCAIRRVWALGAIMPPPFAESWATRHPRFAAKLEKLERRLESVSLLPGLADHFVVEMERR